MNSGPTGDERTKRDQSFETRRETDDELDSPLRMMHVSLAVGSSLKITFLEDRFDWSEERTTKGSAIDSTRRVAR